MPFLFHEIEKISEGWDNEEELLALWEYDDCLFQWSRSGFATAWKGWQTLQLNGDRVQVKIGLPTVQWLLPYLDYRELVILLALGPQVTLRTFNRDSNTWQNFNATMLLTERTQPNNNRYYDLDYDITFIDLRVL